MITKPYLTDPQTPWYYNYTTSQWEVQGGAGGAKAVELYAYQPSSLSTLPLTLDASGNLMVTGGGGGSGSNAAAGLTGVAPPSSADYTGWSSAGNLVGVSLANAMPVQPGTGATFPVSIAASVAVTGTFWQATQPVSGTVAVSNFPATQPVSGTVTANQGTANSLANAWPHELTDGTNGPVAVKAASTAAVAADKALVVAVSPNNSVAVTGTFWQATQPVSGTVAVSNFPASQAVTGTLSFNGVVADATAFTRGTTLELPVGGVVEAVQSGLTTAQTRALSLTTAGLLRVDGSNVTQPVSLASTTITGTVAVTESGTWTVRVVGNAGATLDQASGSAVPTNGLLVGGGSVAGGTNFTALTVKAASTAAAATDTSLVVQPLVGSAAMSTAAAGVQKVGITGAAAAVMDSVTTAATTPANAMAVSVANVTTAPSLATGQSVALQGDYTGSVFVKPHRRSNTKAATGTFTSTTATSLLAAQASGVFADLAGLSITQGLGATANVFFSVNISDGTATYKFNMYSPSAVTNTGPPTLNMNFDPPIPATNAATAWTVALSSATDTPTVNVTAVFVLQKAS